MLTTQTRRWIFVLSCLGFVLGCQTADKSASCNSLDWFEIGRQSGTAGHPPALASEKKRCSGQLDASAQALYITGYNKGLSDFCTPENGYTLGRSGSPTSSACPITSRTNFQVAYKRGVRAKELSEENLQIDRKITSINEKLKTKDRNQTKSKLKTELNGLKQQREANERNLQKIEKSTN